MSLLIVWIHVWCLQGLKFSPRAFASRKSVKKSMKEGQLPRKSVTDSSSGDDDYGQDEQKVDPSEDSTEQKPLATPSRSTVLQACTVTSGLIAALGIIIRQVGFSVMQIQLSTLLKKCFLLGFVHLVSLPIQSNFLIVFWQGSHFASLEGLPILDCSSKASCMDFHDLFFAVSYKSFLMHGYFEKAFYFLNVPGAGFCAVD